MENDANKIQFVSDYPVANLKPYDRNPRRNDAAVDAVVRSIEAFGFKSPIVINADGVICAGHTRYKAALQIGLATVPVIISPDLTGERFVGYNIADNQTASIAAWADDELRTLLAELNGSETFDMAALGFEPDELGKLLGERFDVPDYSGQREPATDDVIVTIVADRATFERAEKSLKELCEAHGLHFTVA